MSMIQKEISDFRVQAYHQGAFQTVSKADVLGKWAVFFLLSLIHICCWRPARSTGRLPNPKGKEGRADGGTEEDPGGGGGRFPV